MLVSIALALAAQAAAPPGEPRYLRVSFNPRQWDDTLIRPAAPSGTIAPWFKIDGAAFKAMNALPADSYPYASGTFTVDADGKVGECAPELRFEKSAGAIALAEAICTDLRAHGRFVPSLDATGRRVATTMGIFAKASDKRGLYGFGGDNPPLVSDMPPPPAPPMPPNYWMPSFESGHYQVSGARLFAGDRKLIASGGLRWTGVSLALDPAGKTACKVAKSSGDLGDDARACKVAGKYKVSEAAATAARFYKRGAMVMMVHDRGKPSALLPVRKEAVRARLTQAGAARVAAIVGRPVDDDALAKRVSASIDREGIATRCRIEASDGNDAADLALCRTLRSDALFTPAEDVFGLPNSDWL